VSRRKKEIELKVPIWLTDLTLSSKVIIVIGAIIAALLPMLGLLTDAIRDVFK